MIRTVHAPSARISGSARWDHLVACGLTLFLISGCATPPRQSDASSIEVASAIRTAAAQVRRCYRKPRVAGAARQIVTRLLVRYGPDGTLAEMPVVLAQTGVTPVNRVYAGKMAEAAIGSVIRCSPIRLPPELYAGGWDGFELVFSSSAAA